MVVATSCIGELPDTCLISARFRTKSCGARSALPDVHSAIRRDDTYKRSTGAQLGRDMPGERATHGDREVHAHPAVGRPGLELRIVAARYVHGGASVRRLQIQTLTLPRRSREIGNHAAVSRPRMHAAANVREMNAAIRGLEVHVPSNIFGGDATICGYRLQVCLARDVNVVTHRPGVVIALGRAFGANLS